MVLRSVPDFLGHGLRLAVFDIGLLFDLNFVYIESQQSLRCVALAFVHAPYRLVMRGMCRRSPGRWLRVGTGIREVDIVGEVHGRGAVIGAVTPLRQPMTFVWEVWSPLLSSRMQP